MAGANDGFNGSTISIGGTPLGDEMRSISYTVDGGDVDVTGSGHAAMLSVSGIPTLECTVEVVGGPITGVTLGKTGVLAIVWNDGSTESGGGMDFRVSNVEQSGSMNSEITTSYTFKPTPTATA